MRRLCSFSALLAVLALAAVSRLGAQAAPQGTSPAAAREAIERLIAESGADVAVVWQPLGTSGEADATEAIRIKADTVFHAASTMKVPVMVELFRQAEAGAFALDDTIPVTNQFRSIVDGSPYLLSTTDDSDGEVYKALGRQMSYRALCEAMITRSSNLATNLLIDRLDARAVQRTTTALGAAGMTVRRGVEDQKAFDRGLNNVTTAEALATLLRRIGRGEAVSPAASRAMVDVLARQAFRSAIPAGVPAGIRVAHKTGSITRIRHDAGIVYAERPYVLVVLTRGLDDAATADALIASISRVAYGIRTASPPRRAPR